jgi:hypothetical protein
LVKVIPIDIAISVGVITPRSLISIVESLAFTMGNSLMRGVSFTFAYLLAMWVRMGFEFSSISRDIEMV